MSHNFSNNPNSYNYDPSLPIGFIVRDTEEPAEPEIDVSDYPDEGVVTITSGFSCQVEGKIGFEAERGSSGTQVSLI